MGQENDFQFCSSKRT